MVQPLLAPRLALAVAAALLAGCETTPRPGAAATAQVIAVPRTRAELGGGHARLHAALRSGVNRASAERGRLALAECAEPDAGERDGVRWHSATVLLPDGVPATPGTFLDLQDVATAPGTATRHHGRFLAPAPAPTGAEAIRSRYSQDADTRCRPPGMPEGRMRVRLHRAVAPWELDFALPELQRHERFGAQELAAGRVVLLSCQLKVMDGGDWYRPVWLARVPPGLELRVGQVVDLRAGATEDSKDVEPLAQVLGLAAHARAPGGNAVVRCR